MSMELMDKVVYYKGRVWTVYATTNDGVFVYEGLKPYPLYEHDSNRAVGVSKKIDYIKTEKVAEHIITGEEIERCMKKMESAEKKELTKKQAIEFFVYLTGHSKSFITKNITGDSFLAKFIFSPGSLRLDLLKSKGALCLYHNIGGRTDMSYFDFITFEPDDYLNDKLRDEYRQQVIEDYKDDEGIE